VHAGKSQGENGLGKTNKDNFIINKGKEQFYSYGNRSDYNIKKTKDKYGLLQK